MQGGKYSSCELVFEARAAAEEAEARAAAEAAAKKAAEEAAARKLKEEAEAREALVGEDNSIVSGSAVGKISSTETETQCSIVC